MTIPRTLEEWDLNVIKNLLARGYYKPEVFDFKEFLPYSKDEDGKTRLRKTCCALANSSSGGFLIFGVKDDKSLTVDERLVGIDPKTDFPVQFGSYPANCHPGVYWDFKNPPIPLDNGNVLHVIHIPKSWNAPHCIGDGNQNDGWWWHFPKRTNKGNEGMSYEEVRLVFLGYYEKRAKLQLLMAELENIIGIAEHLKGLAHNEYTDNIYSLDTFDLSIVNLLLTDTYIILADKSELIRTVASIRTVCNAANNKIRIFHSKVDRRLDGDQRVLLMKHNKSMSEHANDIIEKCKTALYLLEETTVIRTIGS